MAEREPLTDEEYEARSIAHRMRTEPTVFERNWPVPTPSVDRGPLQNRQAPAQFWGPGTIAESKPPPPGSSDWLAPWRQNTAEAAPPSGPPPPAFTFPAAPVGPADRRAVEAAPPPAAEFPGPLPVIPPTPSAPVPPAVAQGAVAAVAPGAKAPVPNALSPSAFAQRIEAMEETAQEQAVLMANQRAMLEPALKRRHAMETDASQALGEYRAAYNKERPSQPKLETMPAQPDVKIRPWLDPEGKNAISVIAQTLAMFAVGIAGGVNHTPLTAMRYFREAAENWRRDEVDAANSKLKQFEMAVQTMKGNNEVALHQYALADKEYAHNVDAKKAMVVSRLDELKLHDESLVASLMPYDQAVAASKENLKNLTTIQTQVTKFWDVQKNLKGAQEVVHKSPFAAFGELSALKDKLAVEPDPAAQAQYQRRINVLTEQLAKSQERESARDESRAGLSVAKTQIPKMDEKLRQLDSFMGDVNQFKAAVDILAASGMLPTTPTPLAQWLAQAGQWAPSKWKDPAVQAAYQRVSQLGPELITTYARTIENMIGPRHREAYNIPHDWKLLTAAQLRELPRLWATGAMRAKPLYEERRKVYGEYLPGLTPPPREGEAETEEPE